MFFLQQMLYHKNEIFELLEKHHDASIKPPPPQHTPLYVHKSLYSGGVALGRTLKKEVWTFDLCVFKM